MHVQSQERLRARPPESNRSVVTVQERFLKEKMETVTDFIFLGSKITVEGDCSHEIKRRLLFGRKAMTNLDSILKSRDITLLANVNIVKAMFFQWSYRDVRVGP